MEGPAVLEPEPNVGVLYHHLRHSREMDSGPVGFADPVERLLCIGTYDHSPLLIRLDVEHASLVPHTRDIGIADQRECARFRLGDSIRLWIEISQESYLAVLDIGTSGTVTVIRPNVWQPDARNSRRSGNRHAGFGRATISVHSGRAARAGVGPGDCESDSASGLLEAVCRRAISKAPRTGRRTPAGRPRCPAQQLMDDQPARLPNRSVSDPRFPNLTTSRRKSRSFEMVYQVPNASACADRPLVWLPGSDLRACCSTRSWSSQSIPYDVEYTHLACGNGSLQSTPHWGRGEFLDSRRHFRGRLPPRHLHSQEISSLRC